MYSGISGCPYKVKVLCDQGFNKLKFETSIQFLLFRKLFVSLYFRGGECLFVFFIHNYLDKNQSI